MDAPWSGDAQLRLQPFRAMRLAESFIGAPVANRAFARPYRAVPARVLDWRRRRHLRVDKEPALYVHEYTSAGVPVRGIVAAMELPVPEGSVLPHEEVNPSQVRQLANRMATMALNPAPILLLNEGSSAVRAQLDAVMAQEPTWSFTDRGEQLQRVWRVTDAARQAALTDPLARTRMVVADGHHRWDAAIELQGRHPGTGWDRTLVMVIDQADAALQLCAIHRTVPGLTLATIALEAKERGDTYAEQADQQKALAQLDHALVLHDGLHWATLRPADPAAPLVCTLHAELLPAWQADQKRLGYHHTATEAISAASDGVAVLLPAPRFEEIERLAAEGRLLPQKATSFQPKPHVGVVMRDLRDG